MTAKILKGAPIKGAVIGRIFKANEQAEFLAAVERVKAYGLTAETRVKFGNGSAFAGAVLAVDTGV